MALASSSANTKLDRIESPDSIGEVLRRSAAPAGSTDGAPEKSDFPLSLGRPKSTRLELGLKDRLIFWMLVGALHALDRRDSPLLVAAFFWRLLAAEGVAPLVDGCARCGDAVDLVAFDLAEGGVLCRTHRSGVPISADALALLRRILTGELNAALAEPAGPATRELEALATAAMEAHVERRLRAPAVHLDADR